MRKKFILIIWMATLVISLASCNKEGSLSTSSGVYTVSDVQKISLTQKDAGFEIKLPGHLPDHYIFNQVSYIPEQEAINVVYVWNDPAFNGEMLNLTQQLKKPDAGYVTKDAAVEDVLVGNVWAKYVQGTSNNGKWIKDAPMYRLRWEAHGYTFTLIFNGNETSSKGFISKENFIKLAEQLLW